MKNTDTQRMNTDPLRLSSTQLVFNSYKIYSEQMISNIYHVIDIQVSFMVFVVK